MPKLSTLTLTHYPYSFLAAVWQWLLDALFPRRCFGCSRYGSWCCAVCLAALTYPRQLHCPACEAVTPLGEFCAECAGEHSLNGVWSAQPYGNPLVRNLIKALKFGGVIEVTPYLTNLMLGLLRAFNLPPAWHGKPREQWCLTPVPLTPKRHRRRNFNQAARLAQAVAEATGLSCQSTLARTHGAKAQSELNRDADRFANVHGAFAVLPNANIAGQIFILVDDVYTSGATMEACARALKQAGADEVWGLTAAKG